jgi:nucleoside-diphosphate kinase
MAISQTHSSFQQADLNIVKEERYVFETEWYDTQASLIRKYLLTFYPKDSTAEMYDIKNRRMFIKRMACPGLTMRELFIGSIINVYSR